MDWKVLAYTFGLSVGTGLLIGVAPAWAASRPVIAKAIKGEEAFAYRERRWSLRNALVLAQVFLSLVLLCATGLFLRSLQSASKIDIGFRSRGILSMNIDPQLNGYSTARTTQFVDQVRGHRSLAQDIGRDPDFRGVSLVVETQENAAAMEGAVRNQVHALDPAMAIFNAETMEEHLRDALVFPRLAGTLFGVFGITGLILTVLGLYGIMTYTVSRRTREIGIRLALGA